ncbi:adenosylcobinamide-phosphate synthase [Thalassococcus halodurans]|uniref:Cobalamin biosynthesis protein CobD n=1 Tax=Thalassococcus halodurans TaxID=373675 RepID=A0A1H6A3A1_9RHOB|nr:adenosylcobinamide-phosphate synthase CbiB [Thalassococcus halodurans]SEG42704.1 adenosylcobinamide-phosphate synthase [Thalassococcus halodurans]
MSFALMMLGGMILDLAFGWPDKLYARIGHPVTWIGKAITLCETRLNNGSRNARIFGGAVTVLVVVALAAVPMIVVQAALPDSWIGTLIGAVLAWPMIALRSMRDHYQAVATALAANDLPAARYAVSMIVGRNPSQLDAPAVARAATESLAENTSDGIVAPLFWGALLGLPGIYAYKAINTMDSMIGHKSDRYEAFGKVAARVDDVVNLIPARLTGLAFACASRRPLVALKSMLRDAPNHRSPNAGWPEGAMAAALNVRLSGPRIYDGHTANEPWLNEGAPDPDAQAMRKAVSLYHRALVLCGLALAGLAML